MKPIFGSMVAEKFLRALQPTNKAGVATVPAGHPLPRKLTCETDVDWMKRVRDGFEAHFDLEEQVALWGRLEWQDFNVLRHASIEALIAVGPEEATLGGLLDGRSRHQYLRLDYHLDALGPIWKEPAPHVHIVHDGEPRFASTRISTDLPIADFVDFVFRNYRHREWRDWLHGEWFDRFVVEPQQDIFDWIDRAFCDSKIEVLARPETTAVLEQLKVVLRAQKAERNALTIPAPIASLFG